MADIAFDWDSLTVGEVIELEEIAGVSVDDIQKAGQPKGKVVLAMLFIVKRRDDPTFTLEQARALPVSAMSEIVGGTERPTSPAG